MLVSVFTKNANPSAKIAEGAIYAFTANLSIGAKSVEVLAFVYTTN